MRGAKSSKSGAAVHIFVAAVCVFALTIPFIKALAKSSISIDGNVNGYEWEGAYEWMITDIYNETNCDLTYIHCGIIIADNNTVYFYVNAMGGTIESGNQLIALSAEADGMGYAYSSADGTYKFDANVYESESKFSYCYGNGFTFESRLGVKHGIGETLRFSLRVYDGKGNPSNNYHINLPNPTFTTTQPSTNYTNLTAHEPNSAVTTRERRTTEDFSFTRRETSTTGKTATTKEKTTKAPKAEKKKTVKSTGVTKESTAVTASVTEQTATLAAIPETTAAAGTASDTEVSYRSNQKYIIMVIMSAAMITAALVITAAAGKRKPR